jgi:hypothetical protein
VRAASALSVTKLECGKPFHAGQFDAVWLVNQGDAAQDLAGWLLRSDGENEQMALGTLGTLDAGEQLVLVAGAHAVQVPSENVYVWTLNEVLRDSGEPPDYVRLMDPGGNLVSGLDCAGGVPGAAPTPAPVTPAPQQASAGSQPDPASAGGPKAIPNTGGLPGGNDAGTGSYATEAAALLAVAIGGYSLIKGPRWVVPNRRNTGRLMAHEGDIREGRKRTSGPPRG